MISSILYAALVFAVLVVVHEAGHFAMAKKVGVRVLRFSVGYPPRILGFRRGETEYSIGATPFGGYVRMLGDEVGEKPTPDEIKMYLHEIGLDLIGAAREHGVVQAGSGFDDNLRVVAERLSETSDSAAPPTRRYPYSLATRRLRLRYLTRRRCRCLRTLGPHRPRAQA